MKKTPKEIREIIVSFFREHGGEVYLNRHELFELLKNRGIAEGTARRYLAKLKKNGVLIYESERGRSARPTLYKLSMPQSCRLLVPPEMLQQWSGKMSDNRRYITKSERENVVALDALTGHVQAQVLPHADKMGKEFARRVRTAMTHLAKGLDIYMDTISPEDAQRIRKDSQNHKVSVVPKTAVAAPKQANGLTKGQREVIYTIAEYAIKECSGCTKDGNTCALRHALANADVPYATEHPVNCPYELPEKEEPTE